MSTGPEVASSSERAYERGMVRALPAAVLVLCLAACESVVDPSKLPPPDRNIDIAFPDLVPDPVSDVPAESEMREEVVEDTVEDVHEEEAVLPGDCSLDLATFTPGAERAGISDMDEVWTVQGAITTGFGSDPFSFLDVESWYGDGGPTTPGTYEITERVSTHTCGLCLFVCEGCAATSSHCFDCDHVYVATRGTVQLDDITASVGGSVRGSLVDAYLAEVDWSADTLVPDGRGVCVDLWSFDEAIVDLATW
jgi:hypothetical protein